MSSGKLVLLKWTGWWKQQKEKEKRCSTRCATTTLPQYLSVLSDSYVWIRAVLQHSLNNVNESVKHHPYFIHGSFFPGGRRLWAERQQQGREADPRGVPGVHGSQEQPTQWRRQQQQGVAAHPQDVISVSDSADQDEFITYRHFIPLLSQL